MAYDSFVSQASQFPVIQTTQGADQTEFMFIKLMTEMLKAFSNMVAEACGVQENP